MNAIDILAAQVVTEGRTSVVATIPRRGSTRSSVVNVGWVRADASLYAAIHRQMTIAGRALLDCRIAEAAFAREAGSVSLIAAWQRREFLNVSIRGYTAGHSCRLPITGSVSRTRRSENDHQIAATTINRQVRNPAANASNAGKRSIACLPACRREA